MLGAFNFSRLPEIWFGPGALKSLPRRACRRGHHVLLVVGGRSLKSMGVLDSLLRDLDLEGVVVHQETVVGEPSPMRVDQIVARYRALKLDWVIGIGGGSAMDAGKAISAMLPQEGSVSDFLEGREVRKHDGRKIPYIAIPTSSGTGSEATKNAVLSEIGAQGYKNSLRHDYLVPDLALIDPELMLSCPPALTAACGLDALTQLLESYVSTKASPMSDALALSGLEHFAAGFMPAYERGDRDIVARSHMAYAAFLSGVTLANAGLGVVHGFASPLGGYFDIPHGVVCGTLLGEATRLNIEVLLTDESANRPVLEKFARVGALLAGRSRGALRDDCDQLLTIIQHWIAQTGIPRLGQFGVTAQDFAKILDKSNNKNSPVVLSREQMQSILQARL